MSIIFSILFAICALVFLYILACRLYWSGRFAIYRLVDFVRSRKSD